MTNTKAVKARVLVATRVPASSSPALPSTYRGNRMVDVSLLRISETREMRDIPMSNPSLWECISGPLRRQTTSGMTALLGAIRNMTHEQRATMAPTTTRLLMVATRDQPLKHTASRSAATTGSDSEIEVNG